jgi:hypothetical protein
LSRCIAIQLAKQGDLFILKVGCFFLSFFVLIDLAIQIAGAFTNRDQVEPVDTKRGSDVIPVEVECGHYPAVACALQEHDT